MSDRSGVSTAEALPLSVPWELERLRTRELGRLAWRSLWLLARRALGTVGRWRRPARGRTTLIVLNDHLLRDIGLTRETTREDPARWTWRP